MMKNTKQENEMLRTAAKLRRIVHADFMVKTANPAMLAAARALLPALKRLGPKVIEKILPVLKDPEFWAAVGPMLIEMLSGKDKTVEGQGKREASAESVLSSAIVRTGTSSDDSILLAKVFVLATIETRTNPSKATEKRVDDARVKMSCMVSELSTLRKFI